MALFKCLTINDNKTFMYNFVLFCVLFYANMQDFMNMQYTDCFNTAFMQNLKLYDWLQLCNICNYVGSPEYTKVLKYSFKYKFLRVLIHP